MTDGLDETDGVFSVPLKRLCVGVSRPDDEKRFFSLFNGGGHSTADFVLDDVFSGVREGVKGVVSSRGLCITLLRNSGKVGRTDGIDGVVRVGPVA